MGGGVAATTLKRIIGSVAPGAVERAVNRWFINGRMGAGSRAILDYLQETVGEGLEEGTQQATSIGFHNRAAGQANARRRGYESQLEGYEELLRKVYDKPLDDARKELEKELEKYPEIDKKDFDEAWKEIAEATKGGIGTALLLGIPGAHIGYRNNIRSASALAAMAREAPNEAAFKEAVGKAQESGLDISVLDGKKIDEASAMLSDVYKVQQERMTPDQREEKARAEELRKRRLYGLTDQSGEIYRGDENGLYMEVARHTESGGLETYEILAGDPHKGNQNIYAKGKAEIRGDRAVVTELRIGEKYEGLQEEILQNAANDIGKTVEYQGQTYAPNGEGRSMRYGWERQPAEKAGTPNLFDHRRHTKPDTQADITAKQMLAQKLQSLDTQLTDESARAVAEVYDRYGRSIGMGFAEYSRRLNLDSLEISQTLTDEQIARWHADKKGAVTDAATVNRIRESLTDAERAEARQNINGFVIPGANGAIKAMYAAKSADMSVFIHEGVHAFTELVKATDTALYGKIMEAAGFDQKTYDAGNIAEKERIMRKAMENLAYGTEAYLRNGVVPTDSSVLQNLYLRVKEFLKDLADAARKAKRLTPEVNALLDQLFGENEDASRTENNEMVKTADIAQPATAQPDELEIFSERQPQEKPDEFDIIIKDESRPAEERAEAAGKKVGMVYFQEIIEEVNSRFNAELEQFLEEKIGKGHIFKLGEPGEILRKTGFPAGQGIELSVEQMKMKAHSRKHIFNPGDLKNLAIAINEPVAVFAYGDRTKAQNVIIEIQHNDKNFLIGIHFDQERRGSIVSEIRGLYPKDTAKWLNWINQGKLLYANIEKLQAVATQLQPNAVDMSPHNLEQKASAEATQQRMTSAEVSRFDLEPIEKILQEHAGVKDFFPEESNVYFSETQDGGLPEFIANYPEVVKEAARFNSGEEMAEYYADYQAMPDEAYQKANALGYFNSLVDSAKLIYPDTTVEQNIEDLRAELAGEPRTAQAFIDMINTEKGFDDLMRGVWGALREGPQQGYTEAETRQNEAAYDRVRTTFNPEGNGNWHVAMSEIAAGKQVNEHTKKIIRGMIRNRPLQYMEAWSMLTGDETWLPQRTDLERIRRLDTEGLTDEEYLSQRSPEELEKIGNKLASDRIKEKIDSGTLLADDPELNHYEQQRRADLARAQELIAERKEGLKDYRWMLEVAERNARKEQLLLEQRAADTSKEGLTASREQTKKTAKAHQQVHKVVEQMERFMREDLTPTEKAAFAELRKQLRERERIQAELKAIEEIRGIKKTDFRQILRKPDLKTVSVKEAALIEWIQAHFDSYEAIARYIGKGAKDIRALYNEFATNAGYRGTIKKRLPAMAYSLIERIVFKDAKQQEVRAYGEIDAGKRRMLYKNLLDFQGIFEEIGIDITAEPRKFSPGEWAAMREEMQERIPADLMSKLERMLEPDTGADKDGRTGRKFTVDQFNVEDLQTLANTVSKLRKEGREREQARRDARAQLREEAQRKITKTLEAHMPKGAADDRMQGIAETWMEEGKRSGRLGIWYALHNARRFFRMLEGGKDGYLNDYITQREYNAFDQENRNVFERRETVERQLKEHGIKIKDLARHTFELWNGQKATLDEMMTFYYAQYNDRALNAAIFGDFATPRERESLRQLAESRDIEGQMAMETAIAERYRSDIRKLDAFFAQEGNGKYRAIMDIIGADYDGHYGRLKDFVAREYNESLGNEAYYMPLQRLEMAAQENTEAEQALSDAGLSRYINKGFTKGRVDIPSWAQQPIKAGLFATWDQMVVKQEHLMAYDPLMRELKQVFEGRGSEVLRDTLRRGHTEEAVKYVRRFISEMGTPSVQEDIAALKTIDRLIRGHYPAAVLGWRVASILKQAIESPPPFLQYVHPWEYAAASVSCLRQETRDMIKNKSVYVKARYFDPSAAVVHEMERMHMSGKIGQAEAILAKIESTGMKGQEWIDAVCVMPGWLAAYNRKAAELNRSGADMGQEEIDAEAVRFADQVVRDCQPSSVLMDQIPLLKGSKNPLARMFMQFQTPVASIFQQLFIDAPNNFKQGRVLQALWTWGIYALLAMVVGAMHDDKDDDDNKKKLKHRLIDAAVMPLGMIPMAGGDLSYMADSALRTGRIQTPRRSYFPVVDQGVQVFNAISQEQWGKAAKSTVKGFGYFTGLPVAAWDDFEKAVETSKWERLLGIK